MADNTKQSHGIGLDCGTMNFVSARKSETGIVTRRMRDLFLDLPKDAKKMLKLGQVDFVERDDDIIILGDKALEIANVFGREARRPLSVGLVSTTETDSLEVLGLMVKNVLGPPTIPGEVCYFSVPAAPLDMQRDVVYHENVFKRIIQQCGYTPIASNEAMAIIYSETAAEGFSGIGISFGSGLANVALAVNTIEGLSFSLARSGDWIDKGVASSIGSTAARICILKEQDLDLLAKDNVSRAQEALKFYYKAMIDYVLDNFIKKFKAIQGQFALPRPIPIVISGGTSLAKGFMEVFKEQFEAKRKQFPIEISEIRQAGNPLNAVAQGLLIQALEEE